jgi:hypothetical protein
MILIQSNAKLEVSVWQDLIDVINETEKEVEAANQWQPFDPDNIPTPNKEYMLLLKEGGYGYFFSEYTSNINDGKLYWHACYGDNHLDEKRVNECYGATYKLIKL